MLNDNYLGEIKLFGGNFAPAGWAACDGRLLSIAENDALFALLGTIYGGDGQSTFGLPDLRGRVPMHQGTLSGGSTYVIGQMAGVESVTLNTNTMPSHTHLFAASSTAGTTNDPTNGFLAAAETFQPYSNGTAPDTNLSPAALSVVGGNQPHDNTVPFQAVQFIIALQGIFPSQN
ncbi:MAG TPA: tail fiber protein [Chitinophagaceae bacterium]|jgi:microcystin-dependent protein|nr:tail fiber protein [Chitinophagaceae bacterium]